MKEGSMTAFLVAFAFLGWAMFWLKRKTGVLFFRPAPAADTLTYREKFSRLGTRWQDPSWRQYGMLLLAGKALGIAVLFTALVVGPKLIQYAWDTAARAEEPA